MSEEEKEAQEAEEKEMRSLGLEPEAKPKRETGAEDISVEELLGEEPEEDSEEEDESEESEEEDDTDDEEETEDEGKKNLRRPSKFVPVKKFQNFKAKNEQEKSVIISELEALKAENIKLKQGNKEEVKVSEAAIDLAKKMDVEDPENIQMIIDTIKGQVETSSVSELKNSLNTLKSEIQEQKEVAYFEKEWGGFKSFQENYPDATPEQMEKAKQAMYEISHTEKWAKYDLDHIFTKNEDIFENLISPKKRGLSTSRSQGITISKGKRMSLSDNPSHKEIMEMDKTMREMESDDSLRLTARGSI